MAKQNENKVEKQIEVMVAEVTANVNTMSVAEMCKVAGQYGIKNAKQYKRVELVEKLIAQMVAVQESSIRAEAEAEAQAKEAKQTKKAGNKKANKVEKSDKRYKADKVENDDVDALVSNILSSTPDEVKAMDLYNVNRKVLIEVMKQLHCKLWYRTYDKPTMITKITVALAKGDVVEVEVNEEEANQ